MKSQVFRAEKKYYRARQGIGHRTHNPLALLKTNPKTSERKRSTHQQHSLSKHHQSLVSDQSQYDQKMQKPMPPTQRLNTADLLPRDCGLMRFDAPLSPQLTTRGGNTISGLSSTYQLPQRTICRLPSQNKGS
jgi:hypothetical protein